MKLTMKMIDNVTIFTDAKCVSVNGNMVTFKEMDDYIKEYKNINRIYKPIALLFYTDWKNGNISNWEYSKEE